MVEINGFEDHKGLKNKAFSDTQGTHLEATLAFIDIGSLILLGARYWGRLN